MVTPFAADGSVDRSGVEQHVGRIAEAGIDMFVGGSSPGQGYTLSVEETSDLYAWSVAAAAGRSRVYASGFEPRTSAELVELSHLVEGQGLAGMQIYSLDIGHGGRPSDRELERYFRDILEEIRIPVVISTHQNMGYLLAPELLTHLIEDYDNVTGLHVNSGNMTYVAKAVEIAGAARQRVSVHNGFAGYGMSAVAFGADGFLSAEANIAPEYAAGIVAAWARGEVGEAFTAYRRLCALSPILELGSATRGVKGAMQLLGRTGHHLRPPLLPLDDGELDLVADALVGAGLQPGSGPAASDSYDDRSAQEG